MECAEKNWTSLDEPIDNLLSSTRLEDENRLSLVAKVDELTTYISSHPVHLVLGGFRKINDPKEFSFDVLNCSLAEFEENCNANYMAIVAKLAIMALEEGKYFPLKGKQVLSMAVDLEFKLDLMVEYFEEEKQKARIIPICICDNFVFVSVS